MTSKTRKRNIRRNGCLKPSRLPPNKTNAPGHMRAASSKTGVKTALKPHLNNRLRAVQSPRLPVNLHRMHLNLLSPARRKARRAFGGKVMSELKTLEEILRSNPDPTAAARAYW